MGRRFLASDILTAATLLTRVPLPVDHVRAAERVGRAAWAYPLIGGLVGVIGGGVYWIGASLGAPLLAAAGVAIAAQLMATGAIHEDGLADCADGLGGGATREKALEIMRDSRIGAFGAAALTLSLLVRAATVAAMAPGAALTALVVAGAFSRGAMTLGMGLIQPARRDGLGHDAGRPGGGEMAVAAALSLGAAALLGWSGLIAIGVGAVAAAAWLWRCRARLGGQTGDVLGAAQQIAELGALLTFSIL